MKKLSIFAIVGIICVLPFTAACGQARTDLVYQGFGNYSSNTEKFEIESETLPAEIESTLTRPSADVGTRPPLESVIAASEAEDPVDPVATEAEVEATEATAEPVPAEPEEEVAPTVNPQGVDYHNYINGNVFDLTAYAEALGCRRVQDSENPEIVMYIVSNHGIDYFFQHTQGAIRICFGDSQNRCWLVVGMAVPSAERSYTVVSTGQANCDVNSELVDTIGDTLYYLTTVDSVDLFALPSPNEYSVSRREGTVKYYPDGMINKREWGDSIPEDSYSIEPQEGKVYKTVGRVDITGATFDPTTL